MEMLLPADLQTEPFRPLKRVEYEALGKQGFFDNEKVELLFGVVVEMVPIDPQHEESAYRLRRSIEAAVQDRAVVRQGSPFAASDISEPQPDIMVVPNGDYWKDHASRAHLVIEVSRSSVRRDRGIKVKLYGLAEVDEYWIVNHVDDCVEVYREPDNGTWRSKTSFRRGDTITMLTFPDVSVAVSDVLPPL